MRYINVILIVCGAYLGGAHSVDARCGRLVDSTMYNAEKPVVARWRTDYPSGGGVTEEPWKKFEIAKVPQEYMKAIIAEVRPHFSRQEMRLVGTGGEPWWMSHWMDYSNAGREPLMGLTKERGVDDGDLSKTSRKGAQIWAVNFYNRPGATVLADIFKDPCNPTLPPSVNFPEGTVAIKFLFTDANLGNFEGQVPYLDGAPRYTAYIDKSGVGGSANPQDREERDLNLLQVDIAVKDSRAAKTGWVFGTFVWKAPTRGDGIFDNLIPLSLMWANDEGVTNTKEVKESWINDAANDNGETFFGWAARPFLGFLGRANGPADNWKSSCLSCHAASRVPLSREGTLGKKFKMDELKIPEKVSEHVEVWFKNIPSGQVFSVSGDKPAVVILDYSLQLEASIRRLCQACKEGALDGGTPDVCIRAGAFTDKVCTPLKPLSVLRATRSVEAAPSLRQ